MHGCYDAALGLDWITVKLFGKVLKVGAVCIVIGIIGIQFFGIDQRNAAIVQADTLEAAVSVPYSVAAILDRSCSDCHSDRTVFPWYASVQPFGWFLKDHIDEGRREINFSQFNTYPARKKMKKLEEICEQVEKKEMPLPSYLWIHRGAALSEAEIKTLCDWSLTERSKISE